MEAMVKSVKSWDVLKNPKLLICSTYLLTDFVVKMF
jgi:hypothetical protein